MRPLFTYLLSVTLCFAAAPKRIEVTGVVVVIVSPKESIRPAGVTVLAVRADTFAAWLRLDEVNLAERWGALSFHASTETDKGGAFTLNLPAAEAFVLCTKVSTKDRLYVWAQRATRTPVLLSNANVRQITERKE